MSTVIERLFLLKYNNIIYYIHPQQQDPFGQITGIKKVGCNIKFVCNYYYCFYNFIPYEKELHYVFNIVFTVDRRKRYK